MVDYLIHNKHHLVNTCLFVVHNRMMHIFQVVHEKVALVKLAS